MPSPLALLIIIINRRRTCAHVRSRMGMYHWFFFLIKLHQYLKQITSYHNKQQNTHPPTSYLQFHPSRNFLTCVSFPTRSQPEANLSKSSRSEKYVKQGRKRSLCKRTFSECQIILNGKNLTVKKRSRRALTSM